MDKITRIPVQQSGKMTLNVPEPASSRFSSRDREVTGEVAVVINGRPAIMVISDSYKDLLVRVKDSEGKEINTEFIDSGEQAFEFVGLLEVHKAKVEQEKRKARLAKYPSEGLVILQQRLFKLMPEYKGKIKLNKTAEEYAADEPWHSLRITVDVDRTFSVQIDQQDNGRFSIDASNTCDKHYVKKVESVVEKIKLLVARRNNKIAENKATTSRRDEEKKFLEQQFGMVVEDSSYSAGGWGGQRPNYYHCFKLLNKGQGKHDSGIEVVLREDGEGNKRMTVLNRVSLSSENFKKLLVMLKEDKSS